MRHYRRGPHTVYELHYHFVFITKYRKPVLRGDVGLRVRELIQEICKTQDMIILKGHVRPDHVHLFVSMPPQLSPSRAMQAIKGKTSHHLMQDFKAMRKTFWGQHLWARGYFVCTSGNVTDEVIAEYVSNQDVAGEEPDFKVSE